MANSNVLSQKSGKSDCQTRVRQTIVISRSLVQFPAWALWSVLGQDSLFHIASVNLAEKWVPSINKEVLTACALYAANCSGISVGGLKWFLCVQCLLGKEGRVDISMDTRL